MLHQPRRARAGQRTRGCDGGPLLRPTLHPGTHLRSAAVGAAPDPIEVTETMPEDTTATVIIGQQVQAGCEERLAAWQHGFNQAASRYPGFLGAEVTPPTGLQPDWVVVYRFD